MAKKEKYFFIYKSNNLKYFITTSVLENILKHSPKLSTLDPTLETDLNYNYSTLNRAHIL